MFLHSIETGKHSAQRQYLATANLSNLAAKDVTAAWYDFLKDKFKATDAEQQDRPDMETLPVV